MKQKFASRVAKVCHFCVLLRDVSRRFLTRSRRSKGSWKNTIASCWGFSCAGLEAAEEDLEALKQCIQEKLKPYAKQLALLDETPGVEWTLAAEIIAELGVDMSVFGSLSQLAS